MLLGLLALFHILAVLGASLRGGRLSVEPAYDDVAYLVEGLWHLDAFEHSGFNGLIQSFVTQPPHAPLNTFLATLGIALVPGRALGPYLTNGLWVFAILALGAALFRPLAALTSAGLLAALLAVPLLGLLVSEFRPDLSWGLLTGFVAMLVLTTDLTRIASSRALLLGFLIGLDVLSKPTGFMPVLASLGTAYVASALARYVEAPFRLRDLVRPTVLIALAAAVATIPYYAVAWHDLVDYIKKVMVSDRDVWVTEKRPLAEELVYFVGQSRGALGWMSVSAPLVVVAWLVRLLVMRPLPKAAIVRALGAVLVMAVSYGVASVSPVKTFFFGCIYYGTVIAASLWALGHLLESFRIRPALLGAAGVLVFVLFWSPRSNIFDARDVNIQASDRAEKIIIPAVLKVLDEQQRTNPPPLVMNLSPGPVLMHALEYHALLAGVPGRFTMLWQAPSLDEVMREVNAATVTVISPKGAIGQAAYNFRIFPFLNDVLKTLQADPAWRLIASTTDKAGFTTYAFARTVTAPASAP